MAFSVIIGYPVVSNRVESVVGVLFMGISSKSKGKQSVAAGNPSSGLCLASNRSGAFSRLDLVFVTAGIVAILLFGWLWIFRGGERLRAARCARNLAILGEGVHSYAEANWQSLPPAVVWTPQLKTTWDTRLMTVLSSDSTKTDTRAALFACPSDTLKRGSPRSYAMSEHDMNAQNWPPGSDNATGPGLAWTKEIIAKWLPENKDARGPTVDELSLVKLSMIPDPANTLLLSELISNGNNFRSTAQTALDGPAQQIEFLKGNPNGLHRGRFNYLMFDGHVELLSPEETQDVGISDPNWKRGIWTIRSDD